MLTGSISGGIIAQFTNLGVPYLLRILVLLITFIAAFFLMKDLGFKAKKKGRVFDQMNKVFKVSINLGLSIRPVRWIMLAGIFSTGVSFYAFYAAQPYLLKLYGDEKAFGVAGLAAAIVAGAEIIGGMAVPLIRRVFRRRTTIVLTSIFASILLLAALGVIQNFYAAILILIIWGVTFSLARPVRQAYLNGLIPGSERATLISFDSLTGSSGGVVIQPILGKAADVWSYSYSYVIAAVFQAMAIPFILLARREKAKSDEIQG